MTIVCATHFTGSSLSAVQVAAELAVKRHTRLLLVSVQPEGSGEAAERAGEATLVALEIEAAAVAGRGLEVSTAVLRGPLAPTVWRFCVNNEAELLLVGDTNHLTSALFESTLDQFAYGVEIPLLVVRDDRPLVEWVRGREPLKVLLALDGSRTSEAAHEWLSWLATFGSIELIASQVWWPPLERERRFGDAGPPASDAALELMVRREAEHMLSGLPANISRRVHLEIEAKHVADRLLSFSVEQQVDLFVVGVHPHPDRAPISRLWSVSHDVLALAPMSVVCVPGVRTGAHVTRWGEGDLAAHP